MLAGFSGNEAYKDSSEAVLQQSKFEELQYLAETGTLDDLYLHLVSPPFQVCINSQKSPLEEKPYTLPSTSLEILRQCRSRISSVNGKKIQSSYENELPINYIIELSAANFIQSKLGTGNGVYAISHPYAGGLSEETAEDVRLVQELMSCAEKVSSHQQYDSAVNLLQECRKLSLCQTNKIQRLVYYFTEALVEKIERESGRRCFGQNTDTVTAVSHWPPDPTAPSSATNAFFLKVPFSQITQFASIQAFLEHLSGCRKIHVIELEIRCGIQQLVLMQALAARSECPIERFKVTAIATESSSLVIEETGNRLRSLATSLNVDFSFHVVILDDIIVNPRLSLFDLDDEETVLVHGSYALEKMVSKPKRLETLMRVIRRINPCAMIIVEAEANVNSPLLVDRFVEALFYIGAYFDSLEDCLKDDVSVRRFVESRLFGSVVRDAVAVEGGEREHRIVGINVWRAFFAGLGIVEIELSKIALNHANSVLNSFECRDSCTLGFNGDSLIVSWKGTPICSLSVWKF